MKTSSLCLALLFFVFNVKVKGAAFMNSYPSLRVHHSEKCENTSKGKLSRRFISMAESSRLFSATLMNDLTSSQTTKSQNILFSPLGLMTLLSMLRSFSSGQTRVEIDRLFLFRDASGRNVADNLIDDILKSALESNSTNLTMSTNLLVDKQLLKNATPRLWEILLEHGAWFSSCSFQMQPQVCQSIANERITAVSRGRINGFLQSEDITSDTRLIIFNVVDFLGGWTKGFSTNRTANQTFYLADGSQIQVPMIKNETFYLHRVACSLPGNNICNSEAVPDILIIPFQGGKQQIVFLVPNEFISIQEIQMQLGSQIQKWKSTVKCGRVDLTLPKFQVKSKSDLQHALKKQGVVSIFDESKANISVFLSQRMFISEIKQESVFELNEQGVEATSAVAAVVVLRFRQLPINFTINRPFLFLIEDVSTQAWIFIGRIEDPR